MKRMEERLGGVLSVGTIVSTALFGSGLVLWLAGPRALALRVLHAGLVVLIATPVGRVIVSTIGFAVHRDWQMVAMTSLVLVSLALSLLVAFF
jgi:uncharacterized membrane protein